VLKAVPKPPKPENRPGRVLFKDLEESQPTDLPEKESIDIPPTPQTPDTPAEVPVASQPTSCQIVNLEPELPAKSWYQPHSECGESDLSHSPSCSSPSDFFFENLPVSAAQNLLGLPKAALKGLINGELSYLKLLIKFQSSEPLYFKLENYSQVEKMGLNVAKAIYCVENARESFFKISQLLLQKGRDVFIPLLEHSDFVNLSYKVWHFFELVSLRIFDQNALNSVFSLVAEIAGVKLLFFGCFEVMRNIEWEEIIRWAGSRLLNVDKLSRLIQDSLPRGYLNERFLTPFVDQKLEADKDLKASLSPDVEILRELYRDPYASDGEGFEESEPYDSLPRGYLNERFLTPFVDQKLEADKDLEASLSPDVEILRELYRDPYASDGEGFEESEPYT
jgi:hypothetical protein